MSRSRWGGFRKGRQRYRSWWEELKASSAPAEPPESPIDFDYTTAQGIWNLNSTTQFKKSQITTVFEGYATQTAVNGNSYTINFSSLTGAGTATAGDLAILIIGAGNAYSNLDQQISSSGWTEAPHGHVFAIDSVYSSARVYYKILGAGETSVTIAAATGSIPSYVSCAGAVLIFSGVNTFGGTNFISDGTNSNTSIPTFSQYTGLIVGNFIIDWAVSGNTLSGASYTSSSYDTLISIGANDTRDVSLGVGIKEITAAGTFSGTMSLATSSSYSVSYGQIKI